MYAALVQGNLMHCIELGKVQSNDQENIECMQQLRLYLEGCCHISEVGNSSSNHENLA